MPVYHWRAVCVYDADVLQKNSYFKNTKVRSAIYQNEDGEWNLLSPNKCDFVKEYYGFKEPIAELKRDDPKSFEALRVFGKLIFSAILSNDRDLVYDEKTGKSNFIICIAYPSEWKRENPNTNMEYLKFFKQECGIKPAIMCITESDAIPNSNIKYFTNDTTFVIDTTM